MNSNIYFKLYLVVVAVLLSFQAEAQPIKYTYDDSGNRTKREKVISMPSMAKSSTGETDQNEEPEKKEVVSMFEEMLSELKIVIYPNPTTGVLRIDITGAAIPPGAKIYLYNNSGILIRQWTGISGSNVMDISAQKAGIYLMRIQLDEINISTWKIIKE